MSARVAQRVQLNAIPGVSRMVYPLSTAVIVPAPKLS